MKIRNLLLVILLFNATICLCQNLVMYPVDPDIKRIDVPTHKRSGVRLPTVNIEGNVLEIANGVGQAITVEVLTSDETVVVHCVTYDGKVSLSYLEPGVEYTLLLYMNGMWWTGTFFID